MHSKHIKNLYSIICIILASQLCYGCNNVHDEDKEQTEQHRKRPPRWVYGTELFEETPVLELAKTIEAKNFDKARQIVAADSKLLQYEEEYFGCNILQWAIFNKYLEATELLLKLGADPNYSKIAEPAIGIAAGMPESSEYLKLALQFHGNPNILIVDSNSIVRRRRKKGVYYTTPLILASGASLENVKLLIDAGADVNLHTPDGFSPIYEALSVMNYDIAEYLIKNNADFKHIPDPFREGVNVDILESISKGNFDLNSKEHKSKMAFVAFLKTKGLDYSK